jgi:hypothetical protein
MDGLFDYLLEYGTKGIANRHSPGQLYDLPQLLSEIPFRNSSNRTIDVVANVKVMVANSSSSSSSNSIDQLRPSHASNTDDKGGRYVHMLEFRGPLLPTIVPRLLLSLMKCQHKRIVEHQLSDENGKEDGNEKNESEQWIDFAVDLRPCLHSFGHNVINDISVLPSKTNDIAKEKENGNNNDDDDEGEAVERLSKSTIVRMDLSTKINIPDQTKKKQRRTSRGRKKKVVEEYKNELIRIRYLTKDDPSNRSIT